MELKNRNILITGASSGIGRDIALFLGKKGANIGINYHTNEENAITLKREIEAAGGTADIVQCDVSNSGEVKAMFSYLLEQWHSGIDVLVNNAGIIKDALIHNTTDEQWQQVINTNLNSVFYCTREAFCAMMKKNYGKIVNISSTSAILGNIGQANYVSSKAAIIGFTKSAALEGAKYGIRVNAICPGLHQTKMLDQIPDRVLEKLKSRIPLGYVDSTQSIAQMVLFLVGDGSDYITGQTIMVNGGIAM